MLCETILCVFFSLHFVMKVVDNNKPTSNKDTLICVVRPKHGIKCIQCARSERWFTLKDETLQSLQFWGLDFHACISIMQIIISFRTTSIDWKSLIHVKRPLQSGLHIHTLFFQRLSILGIDYCFTFLCRQ